MEHPFMGSRQMTRALRAEGLLVHRSRVQRLMQLMNIRSMAPGPHTSRKHPSHPIYPYLLRDLEVTQPNQVWATDITYIPFRKGFFYLIAIQDWYSRKILSWRLSPTLDLSFCLDALREALATYGTPEIFNTDQGSHFTASDWVDMLTEHGVTISMDGKGRALDNVFMERFWRSLKYEYVFLHPLEDGAALKTGLHTYITWYNQRRPHSSLEDRTPDAAYAGGATSNRAA
jgi:putative transposase